MAMSAIVPARVAAFPPAWTFAVYNLTTHTWDVGYLGAPRKIVYISAYPQSPYIIGEINATSRMTGTFLSSLHATCRSVRYRCKTFQAQYIASANDTMNGIFADLYFQRADLALAALTMNPSRTDNFDMIPSPFHREYQVVIHEKSTYSRRSASIFTSLLRLFDPLVWMLMGVMFVLVWMLLTLMGKVSGYLFGPRRSVVNDLQLWPFKMLEAVLGFGGVGMPHWYRWLMAHSFVTIIWMLWTVIIISIISSQLRSVLAAGRLRLLPFSTLAQLLQSNFTVYGTSNMKRNFGLDPRQQMLHLGERLIPIQVNPDAYQSFVVHVLTAELAAVIISQDDHLDLALHSCQIVIAIPGITPHPISAFIFPHNSMLKASFQQKYEQIKQTGIVDADQRYYSQLYRTPSIQRCLPKELPRHINPTFHSLTFDDIRPITGAALFAGACDVFFFLLEIVHKKLCLETS